MPPPKKRRKVPTAEDGDVVMTDAEGATNKTSVPSLDKLDQMLDQFVDSLEDIQEASSALLSVKDFQHTILQQWDQTAASLADKHSQVEKHRTTLANLQYEQGHWESKIQHLKSSSKTPQLEALCREELDDNLSDQPKVLEKFLGQDIGNVDHEQQKVVAILHQQINARGTLERDLSQKNKEWLNLSNIQKKRAQFLHQLPDKLKDMEKASLPLQRFFAAASRGKPKDDEDNSPQVSAAKYNTTSERDARLQLAHQLAGPLYTLFVQLQAYLDDYPQKSMSLDIGHVSSVVKNNNNNKDTAAAANSTIWKDPDDKVVLWQIPIPNVQSPQTSTTAKPKFLTVAFTYFDSFQIVTAKVVSGGDDKLDIASVLQLNPQDTGEFRVRMEAEDEKEVAKEEEDEDKAEENKEEESTTAPIYGKPYLWCNYLAGLQILGDKPAPDNPKQPAIHSSSTRVIVAEVLRHLQANATLHYILNRVLPSYPRASALPPTTSSNPNNCLAKVTSFQFVAPPDGSSATFRTYKIVCKRGNHSLPMTVQFDAALYPILAPPVWSLTGNTLQWGQEHGSCEALEGAPPLHQPRLAAMEAKVNDIDGLVQHLKKQKEKEEEDDDESYYYDWILTHQLREIMMEWEEWVLSEGSSSNTTASSGGGGGESGKAATARTVRGRDRAKVE